MGKGTLFDIIMFLTARNGAVQVRTRVQKLCNAKVAVNSMVAESLLLWWVMACYGVLWCAAVYGLIFFWCIYSATACYGVLWCSVLCCHLMSCNVLRWTVLWCVALWRSIVCYAAIWRAMLSCGEVWFAKVLYDKLRCDMVCCCWLRRTHSTAMLYTEYRSYDHITSVICSCSNH